MQRVMSAILMVLLGAMLTLLSACSEGDAFLNPNQNLVASGNTVSKAELVDALWGTAEEALPDAECLIGSTFQISKSTGFDILKVKIFESTPTTFINETKVYIVSDLAIALHQPGSDGRGVDCSEGLLSYTVLADAETPIEIEASDAIRARHSLESIAKETPTAYPTCTITAYFDKAGTVLCGDGTADPSDTGPDARPSLEVMPIIAPIEVKPPEINVTSLTKAQAVAPKALMVDGVPCGDKEFHSIKLVVDDINCRMEAGDTTGNTFPGFYGPTQQ